MNELHLTTNPTHNPRVFDTCRMTGLERKGRIQITVPHLDDARTAAELAAMEHLLTKMNVCGHNKAGAGLIIHASCRAILDLMNGVSPHGHLAPYVNFLRTRFFGATVRICEAPFVWADERCEAQVTYMEVDEPAVTVIDVAGVGEVELTAHAVEKYVNRFERQPVKAWRELIRIAREVKPAVLEGRNVLHDVKHRRPGRYVIDERRSVMLVIAEPDSIGKMPRLVTVVRPEANVRISAG